MNTKVLFSVHVRRLARNYGVPWRKYCNALKKQKEAPAVNCFDIMTRDETSSSEPAGQSKQTSTQQNIGMAAIQILNKVYEENFSVSKFVKALHILRVEHRQTKNPCSLTSDSQFIDHCELLAANCQKCSPFLLISALKSLLALNVGQPIKVVGAIEDTILQKIDIFDGNDMLECLLLLHCSLDSMCISDTRREIVNVLLNELPKKFHEFSNGSSVFRLVKVYDRFDKKNQRKLDFKLAELVQDFSPHYFCKLLSLLAEKQNRNKTLLNAISNCMQNCGSKPTLKQTVDVLYAVNTLNFPDSSLLLYLTDGRASEIFAIKRPSLVSSLLTACGHLRWRHIEIMEACGSWIVNNKDSCSSREFVSYILTAAALNYKCSDGILKHILPCLKEEEIASTSVWLDVVWSLAILNSVEKEMLSGVLRKNFYESLLDGPDFHVMSNKQKLMNLKSVLKSKHPECIFSCDLFLDSVEVPKSSEDENCQRSVIDALSNFILPGKYMYTNVCTDMGISIDAEFIMDDQGRPLSLLEYGSQMKPSTMAEILPSNARRLAVLVLTHKDFTLNEQCVTGITALTIQLLKSQGYVVVQIPYSEFSKNSTTVKKAHYLQKKITTAVEFSSVNMEMQK